MPTHWIDSEYKKDGYLAAIRASLKPISLYPASESRMFVAHNYQKLIII